MKKLAIAKTVLACLCLSLLSADAQLVRKGDLLERIITNEDKSRTIFSRRGDARTLIKKTFTPEGPLKSVTVYTLNASGDQIGAEIKDGKGVKLYNVIYGYDKKTGQMVEEQIWDARVKRISKETGKETPVRRFIYSYDAQGRQQRPVALTLVPGAVIGGVGIDGEDGTFVPSTITEQLKL